MQLLLIVESLFQYFVIFLPLKQSMILARSIWLSNIWVFSFNSDLINISVFLVFLSSDQSMTLPLFVLLPLVANFWSSSTSSQKTLLSFLLSTSSSQSSDQIRNNVKNIFAFSPNLNIFTFTVWIHIPRKNPPFCHQWLDCNFVPTSYIKVRLFCKSYSICCAQIFFVNIFSICVHLWWTQKYLTNFCKLLSLVIVYLFCLYLFLIFYLGQLQSFCGTHRLMTPSGQLLFGFCEHTCGTRCPSSEAAKVP